MKTIVKLLLYIPIGIVSIFPLFIFWPFLLFSFLGEVIENIELGALAGCCALVLWLIGLLVCVMVLP